jgi:5-methylcytosine-specific restriction enzyme A
MKFRRSDRRNFTRKVMSIAYARATDADGVTRCEGCTAPVGPGGFRYDHTIPFELSRDSRVSNCRLLCTSCDDGKTHRMDIPWIAKANRQRDKHRGAFERSRRPLPCGHASPFKKTIGGRVVRRQQNLQASDES